MPTNSSPSPNTRQKTAENADADARQPLLTCLATVTPVVRRVAAGAALFRQGDRPFGIFQLNAGRIRLLRTTAAGAQVCLHTAHPGELFAEASLFSTAYHCDALALQDAEVLVFSKAALTRELKRNPEALWLFSAELARHVQGLRTRLEVRQIRAAPERVLQALRLRCDAAGVWTPEGTLKQFAEEIGLTHEALYRALATLEKGKYIVRGGKGRGANKDKDLDRHGSVDSSKQIRLMRRPGRSAPA